MAVELKKGQKVSLEKGQNTDLGEILINLNWNQSTSGKGFFSKLKKKGIDLDLGCLYELKDGQKGCIQALGNTFGSFQQVPYVALDGDDRTGAATGGENLRINGKMLPEIKRILIYTFIYNGVANWEEVDGVVTVKYPGQEDIIVKMDEYNTKSRLCVIALLENEQDQTFSIEKVVKFYVSQPEMDQDFHWGLKWVAGRK